MKGRRPPAHHMRAARRTVWWTLPFIVFFILLALFLFLVYQRIPHHVTLESSATVPGGGNLPSEAPARQEEGEEVVPSTAAKALPRHEAQQKAEERGPSVPRRNTRAGRVLVVKSADDLAATYGSETEDRRNNDRREKDTENVKSMAGDARIARYLVAAGQEEARKDKPDVGEEEAEVGVYYCNEQPNPEHWFKCVINAWNLHQLLGSSIPHIKTIAAGEPSAWGMALFEVMFPGAAFVAGPSPEKCVVTDQSSLQMWRTSEPTVPTFHTVEMALAFKALFYDHIQRPRHTKLPRQVTLLVQKQAPAILNELDLAYLLAEVTNMQVVLVDLDALSVAEQVRLMANTGVLVGMHGPGFVHALFLPQGAVTLELFSGRFYSTAYSLPARSGDASTFAYHEPNVTNVTSLPEDRALEVSLASVRVVVQKAAQAWRDSNRLYYHYVNE